MSLSMKRCPNNQINTSFIDISRIKWLVFFLLRSSFFRTTSTVAMSKHQPIIGPHPVEQTAFRRDNGYKSVFTNMWLERQRNRSWIRQKSTKEWTHSLTAVPFVRGHRSVFPRTPRNSCGVYRHPTNVTATCGVLIRLPAKLSKNRMRVKTSADRRLKIKLRV